MTDEEKKQKPQAVGQYYTVEKIAQGGMAEIFRGLAYDVHGIHQKTVCIKKILSHLSTDKDFIGSLIDEAKLAVKLVHGNIAQTYDLGKVGDDYYMVMEFVDGKTLSQINKRCQATGQLIPVSLIIYFLSEVAQGLDYMHRRVDEHGMPIHIVHRDISPQNIMVSYSGTVKIIDFGIAKAAFKISSTDSGMLKGKFAYMSPEQAYGDEIDHRSDIFSLGVILHEFLTGNRLFKAADSRQTIRNVRRAQIDPPSASRPDLPEELDRITMRALAKDRRHRYPYASEMRDDMVKFMHKEYPEFRPADIVEFMRELFKDEIERPRTIEADLKTPALIIENSALAEDGQFEITGLVRMPADMKEFMLEDFVSSGEKSEEKSEAEESSHEALPETEEERPSEEEKPPLAAKGARRWAAPIIAGAGAAVVLVLLIIAAISHFREETPAKGIKSGYARAMVITIPDDAAVYLDGKLAGQGSPVTINKISPDEEHILVVSKDGYLTHEDRITIGRGDFQSINVSLIASTPSTAKVEMISTPPGASVYLDDKETQWHTPVTLDNIEVKKPHTMGLFLTGYKFWSKEVQLKGGESKSFDVTLTRNFGTIFIDSDPQGALVMIDGLPVGQTPITKDDAEPERVYSVEIWHEGYAPMTQEIMGKGGTRSEVRVTLIPEPKVEQQPESPPAPPEKQPVQPIPIPSEGITPPQNQ